MASSAPATRLPGESRIAGAHPPDATTSEGPGDDSALMGLLAYRMGLVGREALTESIRDWAPDRTRSLIQVLVDRGELTAYSLDQLVTTAEAHRGPPRSDRDETVFLGEVAASGNPLDGSTVGERTSAGRRFRILRLHEKGGLGAVFIARDRELNRDVALKEIQPQFADDPQHRARFQFEAEITGGLEHPGIVPVYGLGSDFPDRPTLLRHAVHQAATASKKPSRGFTPTTRLRHDPACAESWSFASSSGGSWMSATRSSMPTSEGCLHRDLKPGNVMVGKYGETLVVDWGLAKAVVGAGRTRRAIRGTEPTDRAIAWPAGSAPRRSPIADQGDAGLHEPRAGRRPAGERLGTRSDVYSLGATLYALLTGSPPFQGSNVGAMLRSVREGGFSTPRTLDPSLDPALEAVCLKAMSLRPEDRHATPGSLAEDVERWMADEPVLAWREPFTRRAQRWLRMRRTAVTAAAVAVLVAVVGLAAVLAVQAKANGDLTRKNNELTRALGREAEAKTRLVAANEKAEARFDLAQEAIKSFHSGVSKDFLLQGEEFTELRTKLLRGAAGFYARLEALLRDQTDRRSRAALGRAYDDLGTLTFTIGSRPEALAVQRRALAVRREVAGSPAADLREKADVGA